MKKTKSFDCVQMKRTGARLVQKQTEGMTPAQELAFWKQKEAKLDRRLKAAKSKPGTHAA